MITMMALTNDTTVLYTRTPTERMWTEAVEKAMDAADLMTADKWDDAPTHEPINITTGVFNEWGYHGWADDTRHRTTPRARKNRATK